MDKSRSLTVSYLYHSKDSVKVFIFSGLRQLPTLSARKCRAVHTKVQGIRLLQSIEHFSIALSRASWHCGVEPPPRSTPAYTTWLVTITLLMSCMHLYCKIDCLSLTHRAQRGGVRRHRSNILVCATDVCDRSLCRGPISRCTGNWSVFLCSRTRYVRAVARWRTNACTHTCRLRQIRLDAWLRTVVDLLDLGAADRSRSRVKYSRSCVKVDVPLSQLNVNFPIMWTKSRVNDC